jgi:alkyl hydroperoxide reductase subunit D
MTRLARPATSQLDLELFSLAVSAIGGCEACVRSHEEALVRGGVRIEQVHEAVRIAAVVRGVATALALAPRALATVLPGPQAS